MTFDNTLGRLNVYELTIWKGRCQVCGKLFYSCLEEPKHCTQAPDIAFGIEKKVRIMDVPSKSD